MNTTAILASLQRVLIVEDEAMIAMMVEDMVELLGFAIAGVAGTVADALSMLNAGTPVDIALLDVNVGGEKVFAVADALAAMNIPFIFCTGYGRAGVEARFADSQVLAKPYDLAMLRSALDAARHKPF